MKAHFKIALRYIFSKHNFNFITIINFLSLIGIMIGVAALIIVHSIFNAFQQIAIDQIIGFDPHIIIKTNSETDYHKILSSFSTDKNVSSIASVNENRIIAVKGKTARMVNLLAIEDSTNRYLRKLRNTIIVGTTSLLTTESIPRVLIGSGLASAYDVLVGDTLALTTPKEIEGNLLSFSLPDVNNVIIEGIFQSNVKDYDYSYIFANQQIYPSLLEKNDKFSIYIKIKNIDDLIKMQKLFKNKFVNASIFSWKDLNKEFYGVMQFEKMATTFVLSIVLIVAIFNVFASLTMTVLEKKKDISILRAMGATSMFIRKLYLWEGITVGILGTFLGATLGVSLCWGEQSFKWLKLDASKYIMDSIPVELNYLDVLLIMLLSLFLTFSATIYPAYRASKLNIIDSIREE
jgi:lipoprotein-releasing system permease protein